MAVLSDADRAAVTTRIMSDLSSDLQAVDLSKSDLRAALNAADGWIDANASSYNLALPVAARTALTAQQKARLLMLVIRRRYEVA